MCASLHSRTKLCLADIAGICKSCRLCTPTIHIRDELVLEAHLDADEPHILLRREDEPDAVRVHLNEVRALISALGSMAAEMAGVIVGNADTYSD